MKKNAIYKTNRIKRENKVTLLCKFYAYEFNVILLSIT